MFPFYLSLIDDPKDKEKFEKIYYKYRKLMLHLATEILEDEMLAEDAVQDAFIKLTRYLDRINDIDSKQTKAFIVSVIQGVAINSFNDRKKRFALSFNEMSEENDYNDAIWDVITAKELLAKIETMPDIYSNILELKIYHGLSDKQIAYIIGISYSSARKRLERARKYLLKILSD